MQYEIKEFNKKSIRTAFNEEDNERYFSVIDVIEAITENTYSRDYLKKLRNENGQVDAFLSTNCLQEAMVSVGGSKRKTLVISKTNLPQFLSYLSSKKKEEFNIWLESNCPTAEILEPQNSAYLPQNPNIKYLIYTIRNTQVMLDSDIAMLYQVDTKRINEAVKRNPERFPENFCFQLTNDEFECLRSQIATSKNNFPNSQKSSGRGGSRYLPYAFTEHGILMLANVLHSDIANVMSVKIINQFVDMKHYYLDNSFLTNKLDLIERKQLSFEIDTNKKFDEIFTYMKEHSNPKGILFTEGQFFDAFIFLANLIHTAETDIILIDNYVNLETLNLLKKKKDNVSVTIYTNPKTILTLDDINKFNKQFPTLFIQLTTKFHDRFLILDHKRFYILGQSSKDVGKKVSVLSELTDTFITNKLLEEIASTSLIDS